MDDKTKPENLGPQLGTVSAAGLQRGYQITRGENVADVMALAAPLKLETLSLGVAIAGPVQRIEKAKNKLESAVKNDERISRQL